MDHLADAVSVSWRDALAALAEHVPTGDARRFGGLDAVSVGVPFAMFNQVFALAAPVPDELDAAVRWMTQRGVPFWVTVPDELSGEVQRLADSHGLWASDHTTPGMVLDSLDAIPDTAAAAGIEKVTTAEQLEAFVNVAADAFGLPLEYSRQLAPPQLLGSSQLDCYLGQVDGQPVACGQLVRSDTIAGVYTIGVRADARRRGIGETMSWRILRDGRDAGGRIGVLQSSEMARGVYRRMGFDEVVRYRHFAPSG